MTASREPPGTAAGEVLTVAGELAAVGDDAGLLFIGADDGELPQGRHCERLPADITVAGLEGLGTWDLAIVLRLTGPAHQVLGRLRDLHVGRLLVVGEAAESLTPAEMLALGFEAHPGPGGAGHSYLYDQDQFNRKREWNSPENWANPENFDKYRW